MYDRLTYVPIFGYSGSGKTDLMQHLAGAGRQVLSIETLLNIRGVCLKQLYDDAILDEVEFDAALRQAFSLFDVDQPVYVEWKPLVVLGIQLPESLVAAIRRSPCWVISCSKSERRSRLIEQYRAWAPHLDLVAAQLAPRLTPRQQVSLTSMIARNNLEEIVSFLLDSYFDPLYDEELQWFVGHTSHGSIEAIQHSILAS